MYTHGLLKALVFTLPGTMEFLEKNGFAGMAGDPRIYPRIGLRRVPDGGSAWPVGGGGAHPGDDRCIDGALAARMDVRPAGRRLGVHRISDRSATQCCRARRWPVFAGHPHSPRIRSISPADTGKGRTTLGRRTKDTLEYDREINAQSAVGCDS